MKDGVLMRKYYGEDGSVIHNQIIIPKHLVPELLSTLHGKTNKHPGITKMIQECRAKYYFPGLARKIRAWVTSCQDCIANKRIDTRQIRPKMLSNTEFTMGPEDCLEVDILPNLPSSNGYQHIITMMDVFSRYLFAYPTQDMTAKTVARCIIDVMTRHCYLPTVILTDKGSQFRSEVINQIAQTLDIRIRHASTKHAQTIGILERTHASLKTSLKISTGERRSMWHKYVQIAVMNYNTSYHESLGCEPTTVFHGRIPYNILDIKLGLKPNWEKDSNEELTDQLQKQIAGEVLFGNNTENAAKEATVTEIEDITGNDEITTENDVVKTITNELTAENDVVKTTTSEDITKNDVAQTATNENTAEDKAPSDNITSFDLDVSDNPYILTPPPIQSPPKTPELPPIVVGYNPRKVLRYNLRPNPRPNANPDFRMLDSATTEDLRSTQN